MAERKLTVVLAGDSRGLERAMGSAGKSTSSFGGKLASFGKTAAIGLGALGVGAVVLGKSFVDAAVESQKVTAQTAAVIKSMGGVAGVTSKQVADLSTALSLKSGVDDELIQSGQNVLLTFANVQNAVGDGPKVFDRATAAALDMSVALGTDMSSASMQLGKALNDPTAGIAKLSRAGIQFTDEQKETIRTLQEGGDMAGAQAVMLAELERQFGGSAEAQATAGDKLKVAWGNLQEQLGEKLLPVFEKVASFLAASLPGAMRGAENAFRSLQPTIASVVGFVQENFPKVQAAVASVVAFVQEHWPQISAVISSAMATISTVISGAVSVLTTLWQNFGNNILLFVQQVWPAIQLVIQGAMDIIRGIVTTVTSLIQGDWAGVWEGIKLVVSGAWAAIQGIIRVALETIQLVMGIALEVIGSVFRAAWDGLVSFFAGIPARFSAIAALAWEALKNGLQAAKEFITGRIDAIISWVASAPGKIASVVSGMWNALKNGLEAAVAWIMGKLGGIIAAAQRVKDALAGLGRTFGSSGGGMPQDMMRARAAGGPVSRGTPYIVGEVGPELFIPNGSGTIIPNNQLGGGGMAAMGGTTINLYLAGSVVSERDLISTIRTAIAKGI